ncbi:ComEA family DNA-binding protein [Streptomyces sp. NBC_01264]|uniref:ComEA family DNA-binding protein n=1 Tax=Streptomyces sp. NBC_01264 TaxID=2903804 RepID=UPI0022556BC1|nr:ComEA family DNA-binding protein [Streptomyces sp. NBC_01264]MCX4778346.1 ComEA family DNA-binding protein [Streptomyces sp. NBC_01264]
MTLRTRTSGPAGATSGPGRPRLSDGRLRHRRAARPGHPDPAVVRRRAEALLGAGRPPGAPPPAGAAPRGNPSVGVVAGPEAPTLPDPSARPRPAVRSEVPARGGAEVPPEERAVPGGALRWLALRERLPVWLHTRCGVEPRTVAAVSVVLVVALGFAVQQYGAARPRPVTAPAVVAPAAAAVPAPTAVRAGPGAGPVLVDVSGKVREPGVRKLPPGSRVEDALAAAGGVRPGTDTTGLNRARVLLDGEQVMVGAPAPPPPTGRGGPASGPLSLGTATAEQLDGLPGVGPVLAQHIVDFRTVRGGFRSVEELRQVNGIGERRFADLRELVRP